MTEVLPSDTNGTPRSEVPTFDHVTRAKPSEDETQTTKFVRYATKKTVAEGMLDVALLLSNASQLKSLLDVGAEHKFYYLVLSFIIISLFLQVVTGILLVVLGNMGFRSAAQKKRANSVNNVCVGFILVITTVNVFITAFGIKLSHRTSS